MLLSVIAAMDRGGVIGNDSGMPWHLPRDLRRFRTLTAGKPVIMGRKTYDAIGGPLPGRFNIVLSHRDETVCPDCVTVRSITRSLDVASHHLAEIGADEAMVIGGGTIFRQMTPLCRRAYLTIVDDYFAGDTHFPVDLYSGQSWRKSAGTDVQPPDTKNPHGLWFIDLVRPRDAGVDLMPFDLSSWVRRPESRVPEFA